MKIVENDSLVEVSLSEKLTQNNIKEMYDIIEQVANDKFNVCFCSHSNGNTLQFIGVGDTLSIEYVNSATEQVYKIQDKSKVSNNDEINIYSEWGMSTFPEHSVVDYEQVKTLFDCFFKTDNFEEFKKQIDSLGFTVMLFVPDFA